MDKLYIQGLRLKTTIGCLDWEQQMLQTVVVDIELEIDNAKISATDDVNQTFDYAQMAEKLQTFASVHTCQLIETLAEKMAAYLQQHYAPTWLKLSLQKPGAIPHAQTVGVVIERRYK